MIGLCGTRRSICQLGSLQESPFWLGGQAQLSAWLVFISASTIARYLPLELNADPPILIGPSLLHRYRGSGCWRFRLGPLVGSRIHGYGLPAIESARAKDRRALESFSPFSTLCIKNSGWMAKVEYKWVNSIQHPRSEKSTPQSDWGLSYGAYGIRDAYIA